MSDFIQSAIIQAMRARGYNLEQARLAAVQGLAQLPGAEQLVSEAVAAIKKQALAITMLERLPGVVAPAVHEDLKEGPWYTGPLEDATSIWSRLKTRLEGSLGSALPSLDEASSKVVGHLAQPKVRNLKKRGLVLGYVQSGKTANYTAVMAKAADAGYKTFIVLSGMHNNLRKQTQARIDRDLDTHSSDWLRLTTTEADFGAVVDGNALVAKGVRCVAVVKKNATRLTNLRDWLRDIDPALRARSPILIIDDEADQATPNSLAAKNTISAINRLLREIWAEVNNGTYVGYTATPFANIFMDPDDETELYPADFIFDLPQAEEYFGAERIFGRVALDDADDPDDGLDVVRTIDPDEASALSPRANERHDHDPDLPPSLIDAVRWFLIATAVRRIRGQEMEHSSMLVHTTAYIEPHFAMKHRLSALLDQFSIALADEEEPWKALFRKEIGAVSGLNQFEAPSWDQVRAQLPSVLGDARVVVDNGSSNDRLDYGRIDAEGEPIPEVVIAVGGSTLSRGLTLEGLIVSYFVRSSSTYDTLLQMGRWFGFRTGYEDLPRIWVTDDLLDDFRFLALVEEELRRDMRRLESLSVTPKQFGVRVRAHPGRLSITSRNKMVHADLVRVSYSGQRHQTIVLHEKDGAKLNDNLEAVKRLLHTCKTCAEPGGLRLPAHTQFHGIPREVISDFLKRYHFHPDQPGLRRDHITGWLDTAARDIEWNVVVMGTTKTLMKNNEPVVLGTVDLGLGYPVPMVNRSALTSPGPGTANIKALLSQSDWLADFPPSKVRELAPKSQDDYRRIRFAHPGQSGLLIIYVVSPKSIPLRATQEGHRRPLAAVAPVVGLGFVFPETFAGVQNAEGDYYSVRPDWAETLEEVEDALPQDNEDSTKITAKDLEGLTIG
ncbi:Z1 domain-containing protein [Tessaracoccus oleiagri]|uniref:Z1 domain-containing protein n=1 Tax=Tessaracoccus oleiagri TaxID=686624 RepID=A0A1G9I004_9ACTN|nr:Z1 domain-containing protein [Tessaracoccus oleiagri]SDL18549.1 Z1 domain-containing protein [Tessaracoccus oleiagri]